MRDSPMPHPNKKAGGPYVVNAKDNLSSLGYIEGPGLPENGLCFGWNFQGVIWADLLNTAYAAGRRSVEAKGRRRRG